MNKRSVNTYPTTAGLILLLLGNYFAAAQELTYRHYTNREGLGSSVVYDMVQDRNGYMWFSTSVGVSRFDGTSFKNFTKEDGLSDNEITRLYLDKHNNIWFISFTGIPSVYHNGRIMTISGVSGVMSVVEDFQTDSILLLRSPNRDTSRMLGSYASPNISGKWKFEKKLVRVLDYSYEIYKWGNLRASSTAPVNFYFGIKDLKTCFVSLKSPAADTLYYYSRKNDEENPYVDVRRFFGLASNNRGIFFYSYDSLYYVDLRQKKTICALPGYGLNTGNFLNINSIYCENDSMLWLSTRDEGLVLITNYMGPHRTIKKFFPNIFCTGILKDHENGYWITTHSDGVYYLPNLDFRCVPGERKIFAKEVRSLRVFGDGNLAAGFADGNMLTINRNDQSIRTYEAWGKSNKNVRMLDILPWKKGQLIAIGDKGTFLVSQKNSKKLGNYISAKAGWIDQEKNLFVSNAAGILQIDVDANAEERIFWIRTTCITGIGKKLYWGSPDGAYEYDGDTAISLAGKSPLLAGMITHLQMAPDSSLWVATPQGIAVVKNDVVWTITRKQGLLSNACKHISVDENAAWISTDQGISCIGYRWQNGQLAYTISAITELDGLNSNDVNQTAMAGEYIYTASAKGIGFFPRNYSSNRPPAPLININAIRAGDEVMSNHDTVTIANARNRLLVDLAGISYKSGKELSYEYRLKGFSDEWTSVINNTIELTEVPYGEYVLEARAIDRWGLKSVQPRKIFIINPPPFWKSTWFTISSYILFALLIGSAFYFFSRSRHRKREANYGMQQKIQDLEILALRSQINPHFIFNCLSSIQYYIQQADLEKSNMYLSKFSLLIRKILRGSSASTITLQEEVQILELYLELEKLRLGSRMEYRLELDKKLQNNTWYIHSMIIQPYIENAIKHGIAPLQDRQGELNITFTKSEEYIECFIEDNGIGINRSMAGKSLAVSDHSSMGAGITESRIHTINAMSKNKIHIEVLDKSASGTAGTGTIVHLTFPILTD